MNPDRLSITLNNKVLSLSGLKDLPQKDLSPFEKKVIDFCRQWQDGEQVFELSTSGSTGPPKVIRLQRDQLVASARLTERALQLAAGMNALLCLDPAYIAGKMMLVRCLTTGMNIIAVEPTADPFNEIPQSQAINFAALVPYQMEMIVSSGHRDRLNGIHAILIGGSKISRQLVGQLQDIESTCYATFGMTETISHVALQQVNGKGKSKYFTALDGIEIGADERSCLTIKADYLGKDRFVTNDIVTLNGPRQFEWLGRWDNVINTGGLKVIPERQEKIIESYLASVGVDHRFYVCGLPHATLGEEVVLVVEGGLAGEMEMQILQDLKGLFPKHEAPRKMMYSSLFVETATGKVDKQTTTKNASPRPD